MLRVLYSYLLDIIEEGRTNGEMRPDLDPYVARDLFIGTMDHIVTRWLLKDRSYSLFENLDSHFELLASAFKPYPATMGAMPEANDLPEAVEMVESE